MTEIQDKVKPKPSLRFWAKVLDFHIFYILLGFLSGFYIWMEAAEIYNTPSRIIILFLWVFVEAICICLFKTTPGKVLFNIHIVDKNNQRLSYISALKRSFLAWFKGMGCGLPIVSIVTSIWGYSALTTKGTTTWDSDSKAIVIHDKIGWIRLILLILVILLSLFIILILAVSRIQ